MTFFEPSRWTGALAAMIGLGACQMENPAFEDDGQADEVGDAGDTTVGESTGEESGESGSSSDTNEGSDLDTTDAVDTTDVDSSDIDGSSDDTIEPDLPTVEECTATFSDAFRPIYGFPEGFGGQCPFAVIEQYVKVMGNGPAIGLLSVVRCSEGCSSCQDTELPLGVVGLDEFTTPLVVLAQNTTVCLTIQTGNFRSVDETRCLYDSLWVGNDEGLNLLLATHRVSQLPPNGTALLGGKPPPAAAEQLGHCPCDQVYGAADPNLECCQNGGAEPYTTSMIFTEVEVAPGEVGNVGLDGGEFGFHVAQSQLLPSCENGNVSVDQSWAFVRGQ
jgi:hypothetical protein